MGTVKVKKVVIDTNVLVSALLFGGVPAQLIPLWKSRTIRPLCWASRRARYMMTLGE